MRSSYRRRIARCGWMRLQRVTLSLLRPLAARFQDAFVAISLRSWRIRCSFRTRNLAAPALSGVM
jgi:hypothetical protein